MHFGEAAGCWGAGERITDMDARSLDCVSHTMLGNGQQAFYENMYM